MQQGRKAKRGLILKVEKKTKKEKQKAPFLKKVSGVFLLISLIGIAICVFLYKINNVFEKDRFLENQKTGFYTEDALMKNFVKKDEISILFAGTDESELRTDSLIYIKYDTINNLLYMMSIPRDTYLTKCYSTHKINSIYYKGARKDELIKEVEEMLDVKLDYYFIINLDLIPKVIDIIGGVQMDIKEDVWKLNKKSGEWTRFLSKGDQLLNAKQIETLVRNRDYDVGAIKREETQREVMVALLRNILKTKNILKAPSIMNVILSNTDTNMTTREALIYAIDMKSVDLENVTSVVMPWTFYNIKGESFVLVDKEKSRTMIKEWVYKESPEEK